MDPTETEGLNTDQKAQQRHREATELFIQQVSATGWRRAHDDERTDAAYDKAYSEVARELWRNKLGEATGERKDDARTLFQVLHQVTCGRPRAQKTMAYLVSALEDIHKKTRPRANSFSMLVMYSDVEYLMPMAFAILLLSRDGMKEKDVILAFELLDCIWCMGHPMGNGLAYSGRLDMIKETIAERFGEVFGFGWVEGASKTTRTTRSYEKRQPKEERVLLELFARMGGDDQTLLDNLKQGMPSKRKRDD